MIRRCCVAGVVAAVLAGVASAAEDGMQPAYRLSIAAMPMDEALNEFAKQSGLQVVLQTKEVKGLRAPKLEGTLTARDALAKLLADTGLNYEYLNDHTVAVWPAKQGTGLVDTENGQQARIMLAQARTTSAQDTRTTDASSSQQENSAASRSIVSLDQIVVTGTRIRGAENGASPVYSFDREDFAQSGATTVQGLMRTLPQNFTGGPNETGGVLSSQRNGGAGNGGFGAGINLRGLGAGSTLVLLNGRRMAPVGQGGFVDVSTIPLSALERIDVLPDGASAIYGSDAVGGVVNFVLRDDYEGVETSVSYGGVTDGGLRDFTASQLIGASWDSGSVLFDLDYARRDPLLSSERDYASALASAGVTFLTPDEERISALLSVHQDLGASLELSATAYATDRDADNETYVPFQARQYSMAAVSDQMGGTLELGWDASDTWGVTLAQTYARMNIEKDSLLRATGALPATPGFLSGDQRMSATELEAEGALFSVPGGAVRLAAGAEYRSEDFEEVRSPGNLSPREISAFDRNVSSAYAEMFVPVVGANNSIDMVRRLDVTAAIRYEDYDDVGSSDTWKLGLLWSPLEGLNLRATRGTSFRAPYLFQLQKSLGFAYLFNVPNPAAADGTTLIAALSQLPAPDLGPENATIWTAGFDVEPSLLGGFRARATYFAINYEDRITSVMLTPTPFGNPALAGVISMPADPGILAQIGELHPSMRFRLGVTDPYEAAEATFDGRTRNQARTEVSGLDVVIERALATDVGNFNVGLNASYLFSFETQQLGSAAAVDVVDTVFNPIDLRARAFANYNHAGWTVSLGLNYADDYVDNQARPYVKVSSWTTVDLGVAHEFGDSTSWLSGMTLRLSATNVFDEDPPKIIDREPTWGNQGFDIENANPIGRMLALHVVKSW